MTDARSLIMGSGSPSFSFNMPGDTITGQILTEPKLVQQKVFGTNELAFWPSGDPKMQVVFQVQTGWRNYEGIGSPDRTQPDNGIRTIYIKGKHFEKATKEAVLASGASWMDIGGWLKITYTGDDYTSKAGVKPKLFEVRYQPPAQQAQQGYASPTNQYAQQGYQGNGYGQPQQAQRPPQQAPAVPDWQRPGWRPDQVPQAPNGQQNPFGQAPAPQVSTPPHHGQPEQMPDWASPAPQSAPPAAQASAPPAPNLSTLDLIRNNAISAQTGQTGSSDYGSVEPVF